MSGELLAAFRAQEPRLLQFLRLRLGSEAEAQDVAQHLFLRLWERRDALREDNLSALLFVTARNMATDALRRRKVFREAPDAMDQVAQIFDPRPLPDAALNARQDLQLVLKIVDELPDKCRTAFVSFKFEGLEYAEIAARMALSESMVRKYVLKAVSHCARRFEELEAWE